MISRKYTVFVVIIDLFFSANPNHYSSTTMLDCWNEVFMLLYYCALWVNTSSLVSSVVLSEVIRQTLE